MSVAPSPRRRASLVASPTPSSPTAYSSIPRPQSASGRYRAFGSAPPSDPLPAVPAGDEADKGQVRVVLRIRPSDPTDNGIPPRHRAVLVHPSSQTDVRVSVDPSTLAGNTPAGASTSKRHPTFAFDRVLPERATQVDVYNATARDRIEEFLRGFNVTFLAYGQTSSGKSYTMGTTGDDADYLDITDTSRAGLIPRTVETLFRRAEEIRLGSGPNASWECRVSFLELYNEDLIDLLSSNDLPVSIRENQDGRIVWSGVREVKVHSVHDVMHLLQEGSTRRQTGQTNMNATSSRSHAIFSLTLTQTRRADSVNDDTRVNGSKRPMSVMAMGSGSRSTTPVSFRGTPPSAFGSKLGGRPTSMHVSALNGRDDMVTITSKFNMVDLAGSERLKRTAAQGERMREGISINSGLLALGNVISALAEPSKNRGHVPYRDSKLTRLLQDSIGGNAMTTMIACVSPVEFNINETINTINYASRARKIKNAVTKNQQEVGWDDIDHLRNTVLKLRTKIAGLETEPRAINKVAEAPDGHDDDVLQRQVIDLSNKLADLEDDFSHLQDEYFKKCREIVALSDPDILEDDKLRQFNETIEPVVLEYEKVVTSLNGQLAELRAEAAIHQQTHEDQTSELSKTRDRLSEHESYVTELQARIAKLTARNDSSEGYIRDLESKFRSFTDNDDRQTEVIASLSQDIQQLKGDAAKSNTYISQLETRVASSESRTNELASLVERYEQEAEEREKSFRDLEGRLALLDNGHNEHSDHRVDQLLEELDERERKIEELEGRLHSSHETRELAPVDSKATPSTPPETPPVLRTIAEDSNAEVEKLRRENQALQFRLRDLEQHIAAPATPVLDPPAEQDEELETDQDDDHEGGNKRGSTGESSESDTTLETPKLASRTVSPQIHEDPLNSQRSPYSSFRSGDFRTRQAQGEPRLLRPLSLSQGLSALSYSGSSPRYSWSAPGNGLIAFERSPKLDRSPKRQSMPFDSKPLRSAQSLEIDLNLLQKSLQDRDAQLKQREVEILYLKKTLSQGTTIATSASQLNTEEVIDRLRKEHADEIEKIYDSHNKAMNSIEDEHTESITAMEQELQAIKKQHQAELDELLQSHRSSLEDLDVRHRGELQESSEIKSALDAAWEELAATGRRHQAERDALVSTHHKEVEDLDSRHVEVCDTLQKELEATTASLQSVREELNSAKEAKELAEKELASRPDASTVIALEEHNIVVAAMEDMEKELTAAEEEKRQLKVKSDQLRFELSRVRDEHQLQRSSDLSKLAELENRCSVLSTEKEELKHMAAEYKNRDSKISILDSRSSRTKLPPIGPPPTAPLPPLPAGREAVLSPALTNASLPRTSHHEGSIDSTRSSRYETHEGSIRPDSVLTSAENDRDKAIADREDALAQVSEAKEKMQEVESKLAAEQRNNEQFSKDLVELRKNNSKLKVRVDDVNRELTELKRERDGLRRDVVEMKNELADAQYERIADRQRLEGARNEVAQYKAKLDRMVDAKVSKRSDQKLKCF
ncbi:hypothetical protein Q8F55_002249 [Vanrija albida]|uniref:Kinesin motor domain-containing protein n=1 Tax=Vanrija albida TaxID=181172 RepID=A0ABR3Q9E4_9TREE